MCLQPALNLLIDGEANAWPFSVFTQKQFLAIVLPNLNRFG